MMNKSMRRVLTVLFVAGMVLGITTTTDADYSRSNYSYTLPYTNYPVINSNGYSHRFQGNENCVFYGDCSVYDTHEYDYYQSQKYGHYYDNSTTNSYNTTNNINIDYDVDNRHYYQYDYRINHSYNQTTHSTKPVVVPQHITVKRTPTTPPVVARPHYPRNPPTTPKYQCKSGETMIRGPSQCFQGYGAVCYQRPDTKRCTRKGTVRPPEICDDKPYEVCTTQTKGPRGDRYMADLGLTIPHSLSYIKQYRIQWLNGSWSSRYTPGDDDIDRKDNCHDQYYQQGNSYNHSRPLSCSRRVRSYFGDHNYEIKTCHIQYPVNNHCVQKNYYYHQTPTSSNNYRGKVTSDSSYSVYKYHQMPTKVENTSTKYHRSPSKNNIMYGRNDQADYFANPQTYGFVDGVYQTFK